MLLFRAVVDQWAAVDSHHIVDKLLCSDLPERRIKCGRVLAWPTAGVARSRLASHLQLLGLFWIIVGALWLVPSIFVLAMASMMNMVIPGEIEIVRQLGPLVLFVIGTGLMVTGAGGVAVGWGLLQRKSWARIAAIILGVLALVHFPFGTALGVYTLWVLLADEGGLEYERMVRALAG